MHTFFRFGNEVVNLFVVVEVERLESVEYKVAHVLIHVGLHHTAIKIIDYTTTVHHLRNKRGSRQGVKRIQNVFYSEVTFRKLKRTLKGATS